MPTLTQGNSASVSLATGDYLSLKNGATEKARIEMPGGRVIHKIDHAGRQVYGPFMVGSYKVSAVLGSVTYLNGTLATVSPTGRA